MTQLVQPLWNVGDRAVRSAFGVLLPPEGRVAAYVRASGPQSYDPPEVQENLSSSLNDALTKVRANLGDTVVLLPGHTENITAGTALSNLRAGTRILGLGRGSFQPVLRWTNTAGQFAVDDANVSFENIHFRLEGANGITKALLVTAPDFLMLACRVQVASGATAKSAIAIELGSGADKAQIRGCKFYGTATHNVTDGIKIVAAVSDIAISDCEMIFSATAGNGLIHFTAAALNYLITRCVLYNTHTASTATIAIDNVAADGIITDVRSGTKNDGVAAAQGIVYGGASALGVGAENYSVDEKAKSGVLNPGAVAT